DSIASNLFMLGYAWQKGWVPLTLDALMRAVELNAAAIEMNKTAFNWGRLAAHDIATVRAAAGSSLLPSGEGARRADEGSASAHGHGNAMPLDDSRLSSTIEQRIERRTAFLTDYQNATYAAKYKSLTDKVRAAEQAKAPGATALSEAVARYAFK